MIEVAILPCCLGYDLAMDNLVLGWAWVLGSRTCLWTSEELTLWWHTSFRKQGRAKLGYFLPRSKLSNTNDSSDFHSLKSASSLTFKRVMYRWTLRHHFSFLTPRILAALTPPLRWMRDLSSIMTTLQYSTSTMVDIRIQRLLPRQWVCFSFGSHKRFGQKRRAFSCNACSSRLFPVHAFFLLTIYTFYPGSQTSGRRWIFHKRPWPERGKSVVIDWVRYRTWRAGFYEPFGECVEGFGLLGDSRVRLEYLRYSSPLLALFAICSQLSKRDWWNSGRSWIRQKLDLMLSHLTQNSRICCSITKNVDRSRKDLSRFRKISSIF